MEESDLLPCPKGHKPEIEERQYSHWETVYRVICDECEPGLMGKSGDYEEALESWNQFMNKKGKQ